MSANVQPTEIAGEHWIIIKIDGHGLTPRGPFATADEAEAVAAQLGAICRGILRRPVQIDVHAHRQREKHL